VYRVGPTTPVSKSSHHTFLPILSEWGLHHAPCRTTQRLLPIINVSMIAALHVLAVVVAGSCEFESCADFCTGSCPFRPNISSAGTEALVVYVESPHSVAVTHMCGTVVSHLSWSNCVAAHPMDVRPPQNTPRDPPRTLRYYRVNAPHPQSTGNVTRAVISPAMTTDVH
jgi:hypothetical protein